MPDTFIQFLWQPNVSIQFSVFFLFFFFFLFPNKRLNTLRVWDFSTFFSPRLHPLNFFSGGWGGGLGGWNNANLDRTWSAHMKRAPDTVFNNSRFEVLRLFCHWAHSLATLIDIQVRLFFLRSIFTLAYVVSSIRRRKSTVFPLVHYNQW